MTARDEVRSGAANSGSNVEPEPASAEARAPRDTSMPDDTFLRYQGLVRSIAWTIHQGLPKHVDIDDLISDGHSGLVDAWRRFDDSRGIAFTTYAYPRIKGAIFDGLTKTSWFSSHAYHRSRYRRMAHDVLDVEPSSDRSNSPMARVGWLKDVSSMLSVAHVIAGDGEGGPRYDVEDQSAPSPQVCADMTELRVRLRQLVDELPEDSRILIRRCYFEGLPMSAVADELELSRGWISRLHVKTLRRLAQSLRELGVE